MPTASRHASGRHAPALLAVILAVGMALRVWYLDSQLDAQRFWDERFNFQNVLALLETGTLKPVSGYYQLLAYLPQGLLLYASEALHRLTGAEWLEVRDGARFTEHAYRLSRLVQAVWGVAGLWMTYLIGRRLFTPAVGLVAATALAFSPWHIHASGVFKPDAPAVLAVLVAFYWSLAADARPSMRSFGQAGAGVALALSAKLTGGLAALPLAIITLLRGRRQPRRLALLALAGGVAAVLFLLLNPHWPIYLEFLDKNFQIYDLKAERLEMTRWQAPLLTWRWLARDLGVVTTSAAAIAGGVLLIRLARRRIDPAKRSAVALLLIMPPAWVAGYMAFTAQFKFNNFLPILPFVAIIGAWGLARAWHWLAPRGSAPGGRRLWGAAGAVLVVVLLAPAGVAYVYRSLTPQAEDLALRFTERKLADRRNCLLVHERAVVRQPPWEGARADHSCHLVTVARLTELDLERLRLSDGVVFPLRRLGGDDAAFYLDAVAASSPRLTATRTPAAFRVRGPAVVAALHPWAQREPQRNLELRTREAGDFRLEAEMPAELVPGEVFSFSLRLPPQALTADLPAPRLKTGGQLIELMPAGGGDRGLDYVSARMVNRRPGPQVRVNRDRVGYPGGEIQLTLWRWRPPDSAETGRAAERTAPAPPGSQ